MARPGTGMSAVPPRTAVALAALAVALALLAQRALGAQAGGKCLSHEPPRPLPQASGRPMAAGAALFVDAGRGNDAAEGSRDAPWKTIRHALTKLRPGDTLCLRGGTYYEAVTATLRGTPGRPITIRSHQGELAVLDGGLAEFHQKPAEAWEPFPAGAPGEFRSTKEYPELAIEPDHSAPGSGAYSSAVCVLGNFGDSLVPLHGYHCPLDVRTDNPFWNLRDKLSRTEGIYCGPGLWFDPDMKRIHVRLTHTRLTGLGEDNYRGETDPRKLPLVIGGKQIVLDIRGAKHLRIQDIVVRGTRNRTVSITGSEDVELDGVTVYGGCPALFVQGTAGLRIVRCALRGLSAPWSFRSSEKYRGISSYLLIASGELPQNHDFEFAHSEFTDCHDGLIIGTINNLKFHHNLVDNFNDDGLYLTLDGTPGKGIHIYQNWLSRMLTVSSFAGKGANQEGTDAFIFRNVIDLRQPVHTGQPTGPDQPQELTSRGRTCGDHGSPIWKPMCIYHNTIITHDPPFQGYYGAALASHAGGTRRRLFNNLFVQVEGPPGLHFGSGDLDLQADGNLFWSVSEGGKLKGDFFAPFRASKTFAASKATYPPGWTANDLFADPGLARFSADWRSAVDFSLRKDSPAVDAGVGLPADWPDPVRGEDKGRPDIGAFPVGCEPSTFGRSGAVLSTGLPK